MASSFSRPVSRTATPGFSRRFGVHITEAEWEKQRAAGIRALPRLKVQYSNTHERYVLCADEARRGNVRDRPLLRLFAPGGRFNLFCQPCNRGDAKYYSRRIRGSIPHLV